MSEPTKRKVPPRLFLDALKLSVRGQEASMVEIAAALQKSVAGLSWANTPSHSFLFLGPTGVGKTETAKTIAELIYGERDALISFDMGAYQTSERVHAFVDSFSDLVGPRSSEGCVILLDEIEKGSRDITPLLLAILDEGRFTSRDGNVIDLSKCYLICTSNLGCAEIIEMKESEIDTVRRYARSAAESYFRPEVVARFKTVEVFRLLPLEVQRGICENFLSQYLPRVEEATGLKVTYGGEVVTYLLSVGFDDRLGARPLRNAIERHVGKALTTATGGDSVRLQICESKGLIA